MPETNETPWPEWLASLTPATKVREILCAVAAKAAGDLNAGVHWLYASEAETLILRLLEESRATRAAGQMDPIGLRERIDTALGESLDCCARCKVCEIQMDAVMAVLAGEPVPAPPAEPARPGITLSLLRSRVSAALDAWQDDGTDSTGLEAVMAAVEPVIAQLWESRNAFRVTPGPSADPAPADGCAPGFVASGPPETEVRVVTAERAERAEAQIAVAVAALRRLAGNESFDGDPALTPREAKVRFAAGTLETIARLGEPTVPEYAEARAEIFAMIAADWTIDPSTGRSNSSETYRAMVREVASLLRSSLRVVDGGVIEATAGLVVAQLAHKHGMAPAERPAHAATTAPEATEDLSAPQGEGGPVQAVSVALSDPAGAAVRAAREKAGLTQSALAATLGVTQAAVSYWETGKRDPGVADLLAIASALGVSAASLLPGPEPGPPVADPSLIPEGTYVNAAIKGFLEAEGFLYTGTWLGEPATVLRDEDDVFVALFPQSSVHLITAKAQPGSEPEQPDPWAQSIEDVRADASALRRNWDADRDKLAALREWVESFLEGDNLLPEVMAIFERDFRQPEADEEPPF